jgi:hypothetical protein
MKEVDAAESGIRLLSESSPKNGEAMIPGTLKIVVSSVEEVAERDVMECA